MASDDSSVSSGSRLQQFGLYRTIDSRTEEFLRLSRKRQIRQGCACAAASTAITVTIVIVIFFVYEFSLNSSTSFESSLKSGWLSLMNDTEDTLFDPKLTRANIDRTTLKLLPLLIKAIKRNAALEKLLDDHSNTNPFYDKKDSKEDTEGRYEQKLLTQNWLKMPSTKLYAIEYKTSPVVYYRNPTKNIEYYTKIRKIRDYQRVFNYVDKMISEKVYIRSSKPMYIEETRTESMFNSISTENTLKSLTFPMIAPNSSHKNTKHCCKCPHLLKTILNNLLKNIQRLPDSKENATKLLKSKNETDKIQKATTTINNVFNIFSHIPQKFKRLSIPTPTAIITKTYNSKIAKMTFDEPVNPVTETYKSSVWNNKMKFIETIANSKKSSKHDNFEKEIKTKAFSEPNNAHKTLIKNNKTLNNVNQEFRPKSFMSGTNLKHVLEPIIDEVHYYDKNKHYTSTFKNHPISKSNLVYSGNKPTSISDIIFSKYKNNTKIKIGHKKDNKTASISKKPTSSYLQPFDNNFTFVKENPAHTIYTNINSEINYNNLTHFLVSNNVLNTPTTSSNSEKNDEEITFDFVNSKPDFLDKHKNDKIDIPVMTNKNQNFVTIKPTYFRYLTNLQDDKTIYKVIKNSLNDYLNKTLKTTPIINKNDNMSSVPSIKSKVISTIKKENKTDIYLLVENHLKALLRKNLTALKAKLKHTIEKLEKENKDNIIKSSITKSTPKLFNNTIFILKKHNETWYRNYVTLKEPVSTVDTLDSLRGPETHKDNNTIEQSFNEKESSEESDPDDDIEFLITEITKPPENSMVKENNDTLLYKKYDDLTWEDLTNEFLPTWKPIIPSTYPKPQYLEYHKSDDKIDDLDQDDFILNGNFYDLE